MSTANTALNRPRGPALISPQAPPGTTMQPHTSHSARPCLYFEFVSGRRPNKIYISRPGGGTGLGPCDLKYSRVITGAKQ